MCVNTYVFILACVCVSLKINCPSKSWPLGLSWPFFCKGQMWMFSFSQVVFLTNRNLNARGVEKNTETPRQVEGIILFLLDVLWEVVGLHRGNMVYFQGELK